LSERQALARLNIIPERCLADVGLRIVKTTPSCHCRKYTVACFQGSTLAYKLKFLFFDSRFYISGPRQCEAFSIWVNHEELPSYDHKHPLTLHRWGILRHEDKLTLRYRRAGEMRLMDLQFDCFTGKSKKTRRTERRKNGVTLEEEQKTRGSRWRESKERQIHARTGAFDDLSMWLDGVQFTSTLARWSLSGTPLPPGSDSPFDSHQVLPRQCCDT
jgi:hypothetical protein